MNALIQINKGTPGTVYYFPQNSSSYAFDSELDFHDSEAFTLQGDGKINGNSGSSSTLFSNFSGTFINCNNGSGAITYQVRDLQIVVFGVSSIGVDSQNASQSAFRNSRKFTEVWEQLSLPIELTTLTSA